jgi:L-iditol 2-dehydrogenase
VLDLLARGRVTSSGIVTHRYALEDWDEALAKALSPKSVTVILMPGAQG